MKYWKYHLWCWAWMLKENLCLRFHHKYTIRTVGKLGIAAIDKNYNVVKIFNDDFTFDSLQKFLEPIRQQRTMWREFNAK